MQNPESSSPHKTSTLSYTYVYLNWGGVWYTLKVITKSSFFSVIDPLTIEFFAWYCVRGQRPALDQGSDQEHNRTTQEKLEGLHLLWIGVTNDLLQVMMVIAMKGSIRPELKCILGKMRKP